jgi:hypothetical protein
MVDIRLFERFRESQRENNDFCAFYIACADIDGDTDTDTDNNDANTTTDININTDVDTYTNIYISIDTYINTYIDTNTDKTDIVTCESPLRFVSVLPRHERSKHPQLIPYSTVRCRGRRRGRRKTLRDGARGKGRREIE